MGGEDGRAAQPATGLSRQLLRSTRPRSIAWNSFWRDAPAPDGIGLQDHYARAWAHVAAFFRGNPGVFGYEVLERAVARLHLGGLLQPGLGLPACRTGKLTEFYRKVVPAIRAADPTTLVFFEPNTLFDEGIHTDLGRVVDPSTGFSFHDYCAIESVLQRNITCRYRGRRHDHQREPLRGHLSASRRC